MRLNKLFIRSGLTFATVLVAIPGVLHAETMLPDSPKVFQETSFDYPRETLLSRLQRIKQYYRIGLTFDRRKAAGTVVPPARRISAEQDIANSVNASRLFSYSKSGRLFTVYPKTNITPTSRIPRTVSISGTVPQQSKQGGTLTGIVVDKDSSPIAGAIVRITGTQKGTSTDLKGQFRIPNVPAGLFNVEVSCISYATMRVRDISVGKGQTRPLNIILEDATRDLKELVVTALGIKREEKSLGYATTALKGSELMEAKTNNWVNSLSGKVAGLSITGMGAGAIGSSRITLRGENSLNMNSNQALIVVDGVPISSRVVTPSYGSHLDADNPIDYGSHVSDINPDDIESINVLKGPAATALYGSRAAGGALIITTKRGKSGKGLNVEYNFNAGFDQVNRWPNWQYEYGEGMDTNYYSYGDSEDGIGTSGSASRGRAFGPRFNGQMYFQYNPNDPDGKPTERTPWHPYKDAYKGYFRTGTTFSHNISVSGGNERSTMRFSLGFLDNHWIVENTGFKRYNMSLSASHKVTDKLTLSTNVNYTNKTSDNLPAAGYNNQTLMYYLIIGANNNIRPEWMRQYWMSGKENLQQRRPFYQGPDNPYLVMYEALNKLRKNGVFGNVSANYKFNDHFDLTVKGSIDLSYEKRSQQRPFSMTKFPKGMYRTEDVFLFESNYDFLLSYKNQIDDWSFSTSAGGNLMKQTYDSDEMYAAQLNQPGVYQISNSLDPAVAIPARTEKAINSLYGMADVSFRDMIYVDITGRNDWSSSLPLNNNSFFYPSVNTSWILTRLLPIKFADFMKLRLSWAQVGNDTDPYQTSRYYDSIYGNGLTNPSTLYNSKLKPEITTSYEVGLESHFLGNRIIVDLTYYNNRSKNQIIATPVDPTTGYTSKLINAGLINSRGFEASLTLKPFTGKFKWTSTLVFSTNRSYVRRLAPGVTSQVMFTLNREGEVTIEAREGGRMGDIYGMGFKRSPDGQIVLTSDGVPSILDTEVKKWGNVFPDWKAGMTNVLEYHNFRFTLQMDGQKGGKVYSLTNYKNNEFGKTKITLPGREEGIVAEGVIEQSDGTYKPNTQRITARNYYSKFYARANVETNIFDASFIKIREMRLEYTFPKQILKRTFIKGLSMAIYGRDLFNINNFPAYDPETGNISAGNLVPGVELGQYPSTRTMGFNINLKF